MLEADTGAIGNVFEPGLTAHLLHGGRATASERDSAPDQRPRELRHARTITHTWDPASARLEEIRLKADATVDCSAATGTWGAALAGLAEIRLKADPTSDCSRLKADATGDFFTLTSLA